MVVGIAADGSEPSLVLSTFLATAAEGDRLALEPYHVAAEMDRDADGHVSAEAATMVAQARMRQDQLAASGLDELIHKLRQEGHAPVAAALLVNRAGWITNLLDYSLSAPEHPAVAEGLGVRNALRFAFERCDLRILEMDERSLREAASEKLGRSIPDLDTCLKGLGRAAGIPWRKEQKSACLGAWLAATA